MTSSDTTVAPIGATAVEEDIRNIVEGAAQRQELESSVDVFLRSNARHKAADVLLALSAYTFGGLMHVRGQGTALTSLSMWASGTTFLLNMQVRKVFEIEDAARRHQVAAGMSLEEKNVFQLETVASWVWMLTSMQQFKAYKLMKYCGYSSWTGLGCCMYFTLRHMYNVMLLD
ncbi:hypothetical protein TraAM80_04797 [Trypanosoma rangeli]|uniref:Uncharacterized protein n=1 Tax=Trypanosoma rangeli TaxID=5698 RepID=A0A3R7NDY8_TRYRA|nr:uncharacterized protein TraAM80_04797 [Trypanosoma rangeli]RNF05028.1 hypothetical protein TraAM80_04797 [Trypanosoma rangeli]|eukprot:RNF05028.1 hypothetical protein TraAM80_04797 [Trypanosoma rangeli]